MQKRRTADWYERDPPPQTKIGTHLEKSRSWSILQLFLSIFRQFSSRNLSFLHYLGSFWTKAYFTFVLTLSVRHSRLKAMTLEWSPTSI